MNAAAVASARYARLDALRGAAIVWMAAFHFAFDLNHFGYIRQNFLGDPFWTTQRTVIVTLFLFCAGVGQAVAAQEGQSWARFWRRWAQVAGCAVLVSAGSALMFPASWIHFGVLHGVAVMLVLVRLLAPLGQSGVPGLALLCGLGLVALALPHWVSHPFFDSRLTSVVGLVTRKPVTEDWVPLFPWLGVMLFGLVAGLVVQRRKPTWLKGGLPAVLDPLAVLGRWSLSFYMLHQPVFIGALLAWGWLRSTAG